MSAVRGNSCGYGSRAGGEVLPGWGLTSRRKYLLSGGLLVRPALHICWRCRCSRRRGMQYVQIDSFEARGVLDTVLADRIRCEPDTKRRRCYRLIIPLAFDRVLADVVPEWRGGLQKKNSGVPNGDRTWWTRFVGSAGGCVG
jgi:hypothetical protein